MTEAERLALWLDHYGAVRTAHECAALIRSQAAELEALRVQLSQAHARIKDMLDNDDGQAWKEARKYLDVHCAANK